MKKTKTLLALALGITLGTVATFAASNFVGDSGRYVTTFSADVTGGTPVAIGSRFVIPLVSAVSNTPVTVATSGIWQLPHAQNATNAAGAAMYWNGSEVSAATNGTYIGILLHSVAASTNGPYSAVIELNAK